MKNIHDLTFMADLKKETLTLMKKGPGVFERGLVPTCTEGRQGFSLLSPSDKSVPLLSRASFKENKRSFPVAMNRQVMFPSERKSVLRQRLRRAL